MRAIIACAGSGGHINPGIAIANTIKKHEPDSDILFIGTDKGMENDLVPKAGYNLKTIHAGRFHRKLTWYNIRNMIYTVMGISDAKRVMKTYKPDIVIGTGGFICPPVMVAAKSKNIPYVLHESNAYPGLSVRAVAKDAKIVFTGFEDTLKRLPEGTNGLFTGTPAKFDMDNMMRLNKEKCKEELGIDKYSQGKKIIFVTGGSQGAIRFNEVIVNMILKYMPQDLYFVIATGPNNYEDVIKKVQDVKDIEKVLKVEKFIYSMDKMYKASDLLITRAGALTVTELSIARRPAILIPLPTAAENHQYYNAKSMENNEAGIVIEENVLNEDLLYDKIKEVVSDDEKLILMGDNAAKLYKPNVDEEIYEKIKEVVSEK